MNVIGICRFSFVGRGDWKAYQNIDVGEEKRVALEQAKKLFEPERLEKRFESFEHLTLASLRAQTDQNFRFLVLASELMPEAYKARLEQICHEVPQIILRFLPDMHVPEAQRIVFDEMGLIYNNVLQFRLDDDDCVCVDFIETLKRHLVPMMSGDIAFVASLRGVMYNIKGGDVAGTYRWPVEFLGAGTIMRHHSKSIYSFGHFNMAQRFTSIVIPGKLALVTHVGTNDTALSQARVNKLGMKIIPPNEIKQDVDRHFPFLSARGRKIAQL